MALELDQLVEVGVVVVFKVFNLGHGDPHLLTADQLDGLVGILISASVDILLLVRSQLTLHHSFGGTWASCGERPGQQ
jgi:hypothetical protein